MQTFVGDIAEPHPKSRAVLSVGFSCDSSGVVDELLEYQDMLTMDAVCFWGGSTKVHFLRDPGLGHLAIADFSLYRMQGLKDPHHPMQTRAFRFPSWIHAYLLFRGNSQM